MKNLLVLCVLLFFSQNAFAQLNWGPSNGRIPRNAVISGEERTRGFAVCRCDHKGGKQLGKMLANKNTFAQTDQHASAGNLENKENIELFWEALNGNTPEAAFVGNPEGEKRDKRNVQKAGTLDAVIDQ